MNRHDVSLMTEDQLRNREKMLKQNIESFTARIPSAANRDELRRAVRVSSAALAEVERELRLRRDIPPHRVHGERTRKDKTKAETFSH